MSKQSDAKKAQGYKDKADPAYCVNCIHFAMDVVTRQSRWGAMLFTDEKNKRCTLGGFAVKKQAVCLKHVRIEVTE